MIPLSPPEQATAPCLTDRVGAHETQQQCQVLWQRARAAGIPLGKLTLLQRPPFAAHIGGAWNRSTGNIWILQSDDQDETLHRLLHELAHAERQSSKPVTIDDDWNEEVATEHRARALAQHWDAGALFDTLPLSCSLAQLETLRERHHLAAELAITRDPYQARAAYDAICDLAYTRSWNEETLEAALYDANEDEANNAAIVDFSRAGLRASWRVGHGIGGSFGTLTCQQAPRSGMLLRAALRQACALNTRWLSRRLIIASEAPQQLSLFLSLSEAAELPATSAALMSLLHLHLPAPPGRRASQRSSNNGARYRTHTCLRKGQRLQLAAARPDR